MVSRNMLILYNFLLIFYVVKLQPRWTVYMFINTIVYSWTHVVYAYLLASRKTTMISTCHIIYFYYYNIMVFDMIFHRFHQAFFYGCQKFINSAANSKIDPSIQPFLSLKFKCNLSHCVFWSNRKVIENIITFSQQKL